ncbi:hypothetical protein [Parasphaerochaeta coccoides]|uniref:LPP20 lipoprotein n=1 Tax=Parasphaerochaeta coccoides (strain ATCC BAA-1237 / DSM 17374 / SPN1) TaxID=760011 RepID=F4GI64_PARC1|nr:hypothetical protein [Parasphaerochaeta coccoides]AEC02662.1 hypothetical protein Spico_1459 [Parasphaerochaeta coccoides DSM 17374]
MRTRATIFTPILLLMILLLGGCASLQSLWQTGRDGVPDWVDSPQVAIGYTAFVGTGTAASERSARLLAYQDIARQLVEATGRNEEASWYRELSSTDGIADFQLRISRTHIQPKDGKYTFYAMTAVRTSLLETMRSDVLKAAVEREESISSLQQKARLEFRDNKDVNALLLYMEAAAISATGPVMAKDNSLESIIGRIDSILDGLEIRINHFYPEGPSLSLSIHRRRIFSPRVLRAPVRVDFTSTGAFGNIYPDYLSATTGESGNAELSGFNPAMTREGDLTISLDIGKEFAVFADAVGNDVAEPLRAKLEMLNAVHHYRKESSILASTIIVDISSHSADGERLSRDYTQESFVTRFMMDGIRLIPSSISSQDSAQDEEDDDAYLADVRRTYPLAGYVIRGKAGVTEIFLEDRKPVVIVMGEASLVRLSDAHVLAYTDLQRTLAWGDTLEEAMDIALNDGGYLLASRLLSQIL